MNKEEYCGTDPYVIKSTPVESLLESVGSQVDDYPHFSTNNQKLGNRIGQINMPTIVSCASRVPCIKSCYANKGHQAFGNARYCYFLNYMSYFKDKDKFFEKLKSYIRYEELSIMRYFSAGDLPDLEFFVRAVSLAEEMNDVKFLMFTKKGYLVNQFVETWRRMPPDNLSVIFSQWDKWRQDNPYGFPTAWVKLKNKECEIPANAIECSGYCGDCVKGEHNCWNLKTGGTVVFHQH